MDILLKQLLNPFLFFFFGCIQVWIYKFNFDAIVLHFQMGGSADSNSINRDAKASCNFYQFLTQSYYERFNSLDDLDFDTFMSLEIPCGICAVLPNNYKSILEVSNLQRNLIGEGSHRHLSTSIKFQTQPTNSVSEQISSSCQLIIVERLPSGVFADPFELEHLVQRGGKCSL